MNKRLGRALNAITFLCISLVCVIGLGFGLKASGVTGENFVTKLFAFEGTSSDDDYTKGPVRSKTLFDNEDGSYRLELTVKGESETLTTAAPANVLIIYDVSSSMTSNKVGNNTRAAQAEQVVYNFVNDLKGYLNSSKDNIDIALVTFSTNAKTEVNWTTNLDTVRNKFKSNGSSYNNDFHYSSNNGTNWEAAMKQAKTVLSDADADPTFVVFVTDGAPTAGSGLTTINPNSPANRPWTDFRPYYNKAKDLAKDVQNYKTPGSSVDNTILYGIYAYGTEADLLDDLIYYSNNGHDRDGMDGNSVLNTPNYYNAKNTTDLEDAVDKIFKKIVSVIGYADVTINDGTTAKEVTTSTGIAHLLTVDEDSFKYYKDGTTWENAPEAKLNDNGEVVWDLGDDVLDNGVVYKVTFDVWPSQYTLDLIADLKNGKEDYSELPDEITDYLVKTDKGEYELATNTVATIEYTDTRTNDGKQTAMFRNPPSVETESYTLNIEKKWANGLDPNRYSAEPVQLGVYRDNTEIDGLLINSLSQWKNSTEIAVGIMKHDASTNTIRIYETGHEYSFAEPTDLSYHWELDTQVVRPMLINNVLKVLIKDEKTTMSSNHETINKDGVDREYFKIDGKAYYIDESITKLFATNNRRSYFEFNKTVTGEDVPADAKFEYNVTVNNSLANLEDDVKSDDDEIWFSVYKGEELIREVETSAQAEIKDDEYTGYYSVNSGDEFTVKLEAGWNLRIINLPTGSTYSVEETVMPTGFEFDKVEGPGTISNKEVTGTITEWNKAYSVTYTNKYVLKDVVVNKVWDDKGDQDGIRPTELDLVLKADGNVVSGVTPEVTKSGNTWTYTYKALPIDKEYTVEEPTLPEGYKATVDGLTITNYHKTYVRDITVSKEWADDDDRDGIQPGSVTVQLKADGKAYGDPVVLNADNEWSYKFEGLDTNKDGKPIEYTVVEVNVPRGYNDSVSGFVVTNTHSPATTKLSVHKAWDDNDNQDGERPDSVTVRLMIGTEQAKDINGRDVVLTLNEENDWTAESPDVYVNASGSAIDYTWVEDAVGHEYSLTGNEESEDVANLTIITNKRTLEETEATVKKVWNDGENRDNLQPDSVSVKLLANGTPVKDSEGQEKVFTLSASNNWEHKETGLPKKSSGSEINYTWVEVNVPTGYKNPTIIKNGTITTITNNHDIEVTAATFTKVWVDKSNQDRVRPDTIDLELYADGEKVTEAPVPTIVKNNDDTWTITYSGLPKNDAGEEINYTIKEINVDENYKAEESKDGKTITNTHDVDTIDIKASKTWVDGGNRDNTRPSSITLLLKNKATGEVVRRETMEPDNEGNWNHTFENVDKNNAGVEVEYELEEVVVPKYETDPIVGDQKTGFIIKNSYTPETITYTGNKVWSDDNDRDGIQPESVTVVLKVDGEIVARALVNEESNWTYSFTVPKNDAGEPIPYELEELPVDGYRASISEDEVSEDGKVITNTITNTHDVAKTTLSGTKHWVDDDNQDGLRPTSVTIKLMANDKQAKDIYNNDMIANVSGPNWTYTFVDVPVYEDGEEISYTVVEEQDSEKHITGNVKTGYKATVRGLDVTNTHESAIKSITTHKVWKDEEDNDDIRPDEITVRLWALEDGELVEKDHQTVTAEDQWSAVFEELPVYNDGVEIVYSITEDEVDGYTADIPEGSYTITNNHRLQTTTFTVSKEWDDDDDRDGNRPDEVVVTLLADGNIVKDEKGEEVTATLSKDNGWKYTFEGLQKNNNKKPIVYTVVEQKTEDDGYSATYRTCGEEEANEGKCVKGTYIVTNTYDPEKTSLTVVKAWDDGDDRDGLRPDSVIVKLIADDEDVLDEDGNNVTLELTKENGWTDTFEGLNKFRDGGEEISYTVEEVEVEEGYNASVSKTTCEEDEENCIPGIYVVTNKHEIETVDVLGEVFWDDADDQDGVRPEDVTICVHANGELVECTTVTPEDDSWKYAFEDLPKNKDGEEIEYTVTEDDIEYYDIKPEGYNFTNKHVPDEGEVLGENEEFCEGCEVAGEKKENDSDNPETGDTILPYALLLLTSLGGISFTAKKIVDRQK